MTTDHALARIRHHAEAMAGSFSVDGENAEAVMRVASWLAREERLDLDLNKGLLLVGNVGTGKTLLMRAMRAAMFEIWGVQFGLKPCGELVRDYGECGYDNVDKWMTGKHCCFDDLGTEGEAVHFGKRTVLMAEIIEARYGRMTSGLRCWTHITTNMGAADLRKTYGERAYSRLLHMCNVIPIGAASGAADRRRTAPAPVANTQVDADNIYAVVHPSVAARLAESIAPVVEALKAERATEPMVGHSAESDRARFADLCLTMPRAELQARRDAYIQNHPMNTHGHEEAMRYVAIIDGAMGQTA